ncbi:acyltransferase [Echinicola strongylocentroti]|nr:DapH/DapD/GlmU-related protein [Echinicola strongylocentroti]
MGKGVRVSGDLRAGRYAYIGPHSIIYPKVTIGDYTMLANDVSIIGGDHDYLKAGVPIIFAGRGLLSPTNIGKDVWIGAHVKIKAGISIGDGAVIAMGSIVTKDVEPYSVYAGVPARKLKDRFDDHKDLNKHRAMLENSHDQNAFDFEMLCK